MRGERRGRCRRRPARPDRTPNMVFANMVSRMSPELARETRYQEIIRRMGFPQRGGS